MMPAASSAGALKNESTIRLLYDHRDSATPRMTASVSSLFTPVRNSSSIFPNSCRYPQITTYRTASVTIVGSSTAAMRAVLSAMYVPSIRLSHAVNSAKNPIRSPIGLRVAVV